jgi:transcription-repair coupling factor (superfamily II helicase)
LADATSDAAVDEVAGELLDRYGPIPPPVESLLAVAHFRVLARAAGLNEVVLQGTGIRFHPVQLPESGQMRLTRLYPRTLIKPAVRTIVVPRPATASIGGTPLRDTELLDWATDLVKAVLLPAPPLERS